MDNPHHTQRVITIPHDSRLSEAMIERLDHLLEVSPPGELRNSLLEIYHTYIIHEHEALPLNFNKIAMGMYLLIECLTLAEMEQQNANQ